MISDGRARRSSRAEGIRTADEIIAGYKQLIERARLRSIKVIGGTLLPFENAFGRRTQSGIFDA